MPFKITPPSPPWAITVEPSGATASTLPGTSKSSGAPLNARGCKATSCSVSVSASHKASRSPAGQMIFAIHTSPRSSSWRSAIAMFSAVSSANPPGSSAGVVGVWLGAGVWVGTIVFVGAVVAVAVTAVVGEGIARVGTEVGAISQARAANRQTAARLNTGLRFMNTAPAQNDERVAERYHQMRNEALVFAFSSSIKFASTSIRKTSLGSASPIAISK